MAERKILITGGAGFIGLHVARHLVDEAEVWMVDNFSRGQQDAEFDAVANRCIKVEADLTAPGALNDLPRDFTEIIHLAAVVGVQAANTEPYRVFTTNVDSTSTVVRFAAEQTGASLFFASTSEVYAQSAAVGLATIPTPESVPILMTDLAQYRASYSRSKVVGESLVHYAAAAVGFPAVIIRPHNIYGPRMGHAHVIPQFIDRALERMDPFPMYGVDQVRAFCYIDDAVTAISRLLTAPMEPGRVVTVNVGNGQEPVEMAEIARRVCRIAGYEPMFVEHGAPDNSPERRQPDTTLLAELTGFVPGVDLDEGITSTFAWYAERRA